MFWPRGFWSRILISEYVSKENKNRISKKYLHSHVHCSVIHSSPDTDITLVSIHAWIRNLSLSHTHTHTQEYYSAMRKKETLPFTTWMDLWASQVVLVVQNPPSSAGDVRDTGSIPGSEDPLEKGMATHSSILAWRIPWTEEPGGLQSRGSHRVRQDWSNLVLC